MTVRTEIVRDGRGAVPSAVDRMAGHLTAPFARGADRVDLPFATGATTGLGVVAAYDFAEHRARFGTDPRPRYVLRALRAVPVATVLTVSYRLRDGDPATVQVAVPAGSPAGTSFPIPLGAAAARATVLSVGADPVGAEPVAASWRLTALLGDLAALLWVLGTERDTLASGLVAVRGQRALVSASEHSLDLIGADLAVRRLPPLPYGPEDGTVAHYHLDDAVGSGTAADASAVLQAGAGHPGTAHDVGFGAVGRFGTGARFDGKGEITVPDHADFALPVSADLTAECFLRHDHSAVDSAVLTKREDTAGAPGWTLAVGSFDRGIAGNVRFAVSDGVRSVAVFADVTLRSDRFRHLAGVVDRAAGTVLLFVDGTLRGAAAIGGLGALTSTAPLRIGQAGSSRPDALGGVVDEVRISRVARTAFHPVLGESDESYRRRLAIFRRWTLPTPPSLTAALNAATGEVAGVRDPFVIVDAETTPVTGRRRLTVRPVRLDPDESIDALGRRGTDEAAASGEAVDDPEFDPLLLVSVVDARAVFAPGGTDRMRVDTRTALVALLDLIAAEPNAPGQLVVDAGFAPAANDLRSVGRALVLRHPGLPTDRLAALAHRAGFSWVRHRGATDDVHASVAGTSSVVLAVAEAGNPPPAGLDAYVGTDTTVTLDPAPPPGARLRWSVIHHEHGRADLVTRADEVDCRLVPTASGRVTVTVDVSRGGRTVTGTRILRIGRPELAVGTAIAEDGRTGVGESVAGRPDDAPFLPSHPLFFFDLRLEPPTTGDCRIHPAVFAPLLRLLDLAKADGFADKTLRLAAGWRPGQPGLASVGRAIELVPVSAGAPMGRLATLAHAAGFSFVALAGGTLRLAQHATTPVLFQEPNTAGLPVDTDDVDEGTEVRIGVSPNPFASAAVLAGNLLCLMNVGTSTVTVLDPKTGTVLRGASTGLLPTAIAVSPDDSTVYTAHFATRAVIGISVATGQTVATLPLTGNEQRLALAHRPDRPELLLLTDTRLVALNAATGQVRATAAVDGGAIAVMAMDANGTRVWIAGEGGRLRSVQVDSMTVSAPVTLPGEPVAIAVTAASVLVTVASGELCVVAKNTGAVSSFTDVGAKPTALAVDGAGGVVHVADEATGRLVARTLDGKPTTRAPIPVTGRITTLVAGRDGVVYFTTSADPPSSSTTLVGAPHAGMVVTTQAHVAPTMWTIGTGFGERLTWTAQAGADARVRLGDVHGNEVRLLAERAGPVLLSAHVLPPGQAPFTAVVQLHPDLAAREKAGERIVVRRDQYERAMNVLSQLHPLGVEIDTRVLVNHTAESSGQEAAPAPGDTFPTYRGVPRRR